jgi:hypothetical protein
MCHRFARPFAQCPFCGGALDPPHPRPRGRSARNEILAATAALSLACGGTIVTSGDAGTHHDAAADVAEQDGDILVLLDAELADSGVDTGVDVLPPPPPNPYGSPPIPLRRVV